MCLGEQFDSLCPEDRASLTEAVRLSMPAYRLSWHANAEAMVWAVLDRQGGAPTQPRFTICRLDCCLVMMIEAGTAARQFCSAASMADVVTVASGIAREVMTFSHDEPHPGTRRAPATLQ